jgi:hypothetical protein
VDVVVGNRLMQVAVYGQDLHRMTRLDAQACLTSCRQQVLKEGQSAYKAYVERLRVDIHDKLMYSMVEMDVASTGHVTRFTHYKPPPPLTKQDDWLEGEDTQLWDDILDGLDKLKL